MKKRYLVIIIAILAIIAGIFIYYRVHVELYGSEDGQAVSVIGGADGPTSIFIAGKVGGADTASYSSITMEEAKDIFKEAGDYIILDVRTEEEYAEGHIPGAINLANEDILEEDPADLPDKEQLIYVYCRSGRRSKEASAKLAALGYTNIIECGGIIDWTGEIEQ